MTVTRPHSRFRLYLLTIACFPFLLVMAGISISQSSWFVAHSGSTYLANLGWGASLRDADCQIVLYGDSTALVGLDPSIIHDKTGLSTCNISEFAGMNMVNGWMILDEYLSRNPYPRFLVFSFVPENLSPHDRWETVSRYEALLYRIKSHRDIHTLKLIALHLGEAVTFAGTTLRVAITGLIRTPLPPAAYRIRSDSNGYLPIQGTALDRCPVDIRNQAPDSDWIKTLRGRYARKGTTVVVDVTPVPACGSTFDFYSVEHPTHTDNALAAYPLSDFNLSGRLHMNRSGTVRYSGYVGEQIAEIMKSGREQP